MKRTTTRTALQPTSRTSHALLTRSMSTGALALALALVSQVSFADEGGVSFWIPGFHGSLAAAPLQPGWTLQTNYYHTSVSAGADVARAREITIGKIPVTLNANLSATLDAKADLGWALPIYTFATPVLGGQASVGVLGMYGRVSTSLAGTLAGTLATPLGTFPFSRSDAISDAVWGFGDVIPIATLRWNAGVHNYIHLRYPGRGLRLRPSFKSRHRARRDRRRRRLYLLQSADRARTLGRAGLHLQFREPVDPVSERRRHAFRLERVAVPDQAVSDRSGGLCLQGDRLRQRLRRPRRLLSIAGDRGWSAARLHLSGRRPAGLSQSEVLQRIFSGEPSPWLEHLGHVHDFAACTHADRATATNDHEITPDTEPTSPNAAPYSAVPKAICCARQPNSIGRETSRLNSVHCTILR